MYGYLLLKKACPNFWNKDFWNFFICFRKVKDIFK